MSKIQQYISYNNNQIDIDESFIKNKNKINFDYVNKIMNFIINYIPKTIHEHLIISCEGNSFTIRNTCTDRRIVISEEGLEYIKYSIYYDSNHKALRIARRIGNVKNYYFDVTKASDEELTIAGIYISLDDPYLYMDHLNNFNVIYNYTYPNFKYNFKKNQLESVIIDGYENVTANFEHLEFFNNHVKETQRHNTFEQNIELQNDIIKKAQQQIKKAQQKINLEKEKLAEMEKIVENYKNKCIFNNSLNLIKNNDFKLKQIYQDKIKEEQDKIKENLEKIVNLNKTKENLQHYIENAPRVFTQSIPSLITKAENETNELEYKIKTSQNKIFELTEEQYNKNKCIFNNSLNLIKNNDFKLKSINKSMDNDFVNEIIKYVQCRLYIKNDIEKIMDKETFINIYESVLRKDEFDLMTKYYDSNEELKTIIKSLC
ncbi:hypothetical protein Hokovirus_3_14 [Hokovirus HKV1]|uniref:Uncharacterized protein n=1 Tax=Hokovirus HKV1 TaxID=1977638 RepID=A0A1V0SGD6_9VIRU|nr:hypothetical protein Hokovirus_3_14 [Hokovirus HKV1]